ncbi:Cytochrome P450 [Morus notabilis]|uniref:Cytochrome P450 n=1 Tax=Morus notabilis TaxID=981085 RepID=W9SBL8_9ROSA|nr:Cytochrome P450 [Morus notabilis]
MGTWEMIILVVVILNFILLRKYRRKIIKKNGAFSSWPAVGMLPDLLKRLESIHDSGTEFLMQNGGTFEIEGPWLANMDFLATCDPVNVQYILAKKFANYPKGPEFRDIFEEHLGDGILNADSDSWRKQRKMFQSLILGQTKFELFVAKAMHKNIVHALIPVLDHVHETRTQDRTIWEKDFAKYELNDTNNE